MEFRHNENDTIVLYKASMEGCVSSLNTLIQKDSLILVKISLTPFTETPLHISALLGHHDFTRTLLAHNPNLAVDLDSSKRSALHLASSKGHKETVQVLLHAYVDACLLRDADGRIPLHYAAMRGRVEVLKMLIEAKSESVYVKVLNCTGETVLHLCVAYNQLECLKVLVEKVGKDSDFLKSRDCDGGKTILHLAVMLKQIETIRYLVSLKTAEANAEKGMMALSTLDMLKQSPRDFKSLEIEQILVDAGMTREYNEHGILASSQMNPSPTNSSKLLARWGWWGKLMEYCLKYQSYWLNTETRGMLMVVATMISTMTFQAAINPPGGIWQETIKTNSTIPGYKVPVCTEKTPCLAGTAVFSYGPWIDYYRYFLVSNTIAFLASNTVIIILISGIPLDNPVCDCILSLAMFFTVFALVCTYQNCTNILNLRGSSLLGISIPFYVVSMSLGLMVITLPTSRYMLWLEKRRQRRNTDGGRLN